MTKPVDNTVRMKPNTCPHCDKVLDAMTHVASDERIRPEAGDLTICLYCAVILKFGADEALSIYPLDELRDLVYASPDDMVALGRAWFATKRRITTKESAIN